MNLKHRNSRDNIETGGPASILSDDMRSAIIYIESGKFSLKEHGFKFKDFRLVDPARQVKDLWSWMKKLRNLKDVIPEQAEILFDIRKYLDSHWGLPTTAFRGYTIVSPQLAIFEALGWPLDFTSEFERTGQFSKNIRSNQSDFTRHIAIFILHFRLQKAIEELEKALKASDIEKTQNIHELNSMLVYLRLYKEFFDRPQPDFGSFDYRVLCTTLQSVEFETPYWRLIQVFLSKSFLLNPTVVMDMPGINFFDRLLFVLRFQYKQAFMLVDQYAKKTKDAGGLDALSLFTGQKEAVLTIFDTYLVRSNDIVTVGLASIILDTLYAWPELSKYVEKMMIFLDALNPSLRPIVDREQLAMRKEIRHLPKGDQRAEANVQFVCYYCKKDPGKVAENEGMLKSVCELIRRQFESLLHRKGFNHLR